MADTLVEGAISSALGAKVGLWGPYWSDESTAVILFVDDGEDLGYIRTTDKGASWTTIEVEAGNVMAVACWYDKETPGDTGNLVHIVWADTTTGDVFYISFDVAANTLGTKRTVDAGVTIHTSYWLTRLTITKCVNNRIIVAFSTQTEIECYKSAETSAPYFAAAPTDIADVYETATEEDWCKLFPADVDAGDAAAIFWDRSANEITLKMYDDSIDSWTEFGTALSGSMTASGFHDYMDGAVRHFDNHVMVAAHTAADTAGDDLKTWDVTVDSIASPTVTAKANVFTNVSESAKVAVFINQQNDDVYVTYVKGNPSWSSTTDIVYQKSVDGMATWGGDVVYSESAPDDFRQVSAGRTVGDAGGRYQIVFQDDDDRDIYINETNDIEIAASVGGQTHSPSGIASLEAFGAATVSTTVTISAGAIASLEAFGVATVLFPTQTITGAGIATFEAFGGAAVTTTVTVTAGAIASDEAFGAATITTSAVTLSPSGIASAETFGSATTSTTISFTASGIASLEAFGAATISTTVTVTAGAIASAEAFGSAILTTTVSFTASSIASLEAFGLATVSWISGQTLTPSGIASLETFGSATVLVVIFSFYGQWRALINPADYPTGTEFFFEAIVSTSDAGFPSHARLYNITDGAFVADSEVSSVDTTGDRVRSGALSLPAGDKEYRCERGGFTGATYYCYEARVLPKSS